MDTKTLAKRLRTHGVDIDLKTLTNWGRDGIVSGCKIYPAVRRLRGRPRKRPEDTNQRGKPGRYHADWAIEAEGEVAAVWAVSGGKRRIPKKRIGEIKAAAIRVYRYPAAFYELPPGIMVAGPDPTSQWSWRALKMYVHDNPLLDAQLKTWVAAKEKTKRPGVQISDPKRVVFYWCSRPRREEKTIYLGRLGGHNVFAIGGAEARQRIEAAMAKGIQNLPSSHYITDPKDPDGGPLGLPQEYTRTVSSPNAPEDGISSLSSGTLTSKESSLRMRRAMRLSSSSTALTAEKRRGTLRLASMFRAPIMTQR